MTDSAYVDDLTVANKDLLWRRIPPRHFVFDGNAGRWRPTSAAFEDHPDGSPMSVTLAKDAVNSGRTPESALEGHEGYGLAAIKAGFVRKLDQGIARSPLPDDPHHAEVFGVKTKSKRRQMAKQSSWVIEPPSSPIAKQ